MEVYCGGSTIKAPDVFSDFTQNCNRMVQARLIAGPTDYSPQMPPFESATTTTTTSYSTSSSSSSASSMSTSSSSTTSASGSASSSSGTSSSSPQDRSSTVSSGLSTTSPAPVSHSHMPGSAPSTEDELSSTTLVNSPAALRTTPGSTTLSTLSTPVPQRSKSVVTTLDSQSDDSVPEAPAARSTSNEEAQRETITPPAQTTPSQITSTTVPHPTHNNPASITYSAAQSTPSVVEDDPSALTREALERARHAKHARRQKEADVRCALWTARRRARLAQGRSNFVAKRDRKPDFHRPCRSYGRSADEI